MKKKICGRCKQKKDISKFGKDKTRKDGLNYFCKVCVKEVHKAYRQNNLIKYWCILTITSHKRKGYKVLFKPKELLPLAEQTKYCPICNVELKWEIGKRLDSSPTLDRKTNQKTLTLKNIWIICFGCNRAKSNKTFNEFVEYCKKVSSKFKGGSL